jgi:acetate CoA/acetoacetate CoA-transferase beta subunit
MIQDPKIGRTVIAKRVALELKDGDIVNLGIGIPTLVANYIPKGVTVFFQSENGILGMGPAPEPGYEHPNLTNAGGSPVTFLPGAVAFDSATSFGLIRGGHVDITVLGGLQVDEEGHLANWMIPGKLIPGMGGAMDLVTGAKKVIVAMTHVEKGGVSKIVKKCTLPLTSVRRVNLIVTDLAVIEVTEKGLLLKEIAPETTLDEVLKYTAASLIVPEKVHTMPVTL